MPCGIFFLCGPAMQVFRNVDTTSLLPTFFSQTTYTSSLPLHGHYQRQHQRRQRLEAVCGTMFPYPGAKSTRKEDVSNLIFEAIARERGEAAAAMVVPACRALQKMRNAVSEPPTTRETGVKLIAYLGALNFVKKEAKLNSALDKELLWVSAVDANDTCVSKSLDLDYICTLFNLAHCEATIAVSEYRQREVSANALARAAKHFAAAASAFRLAASIPPPDGFASVTIDLSAESLDACEQLMYGNAQQCMYLQAKDEDENGKFYHKMNALFAAGSAHYYSRAADKCAGPRLQNSAVNAMIGTPARALAEYHTALAEISEARICEKFCRMSAQLARLRNARLAVDKAKGAAKKIHAGALQFLGPVQAMLLEMLGNLDEQVKEMQKQADLENKHVYFGIDADKSTPRIAIREALANDIAPVIDAAKADPRLALLKNLPEASESDLHGVSSRYAALVASTVGAHVATLNTVSAHLRETVVQAESALDKSQADSASYGGRPSRGGQQLSKEDEQAIACVRAAKDCGGLTALRESYSRATALAAETRTATRNIEQVLANEETEDRQLRLRVHVNRADSKTASASFAVKIAQSKSDVSKAASADEVVDAQLRHHEKALRALDAVSITELDGKPMGNVAGAGLPLDVAMAELRTELSAARRVLGDAGTLTQELEQRRHLENAIAVTARVSASNSKEEDTMLRRLVDTNYGEYGKRADALSKSMRGNASSIAHARTRLGAAHSGNTQADLNRRRIDLAYRHQAAALKHEELRVFLADGIRFYTREKAALASLSADVNVFAAARSTEAARFDAAAQYAAAAQPPPYHGQSPYGMHMPYQGAYSAPYSASGPPPPQYWPGSQPPHDPRSQR